VNDGDGGRIVEKNGNYGWVEQHDYSKIRPMN
jgi:hypothetical protein